MSLAKKAISTGVTATLLASLLATAAVSTAFAGGPFGTAYPYSTNVDERPADGTSYIVLDFPASAGATGSTLLQVNVTGGTFINGSGSFAASLVGSFPRTSAILSTTTAPLAIVASQLWLASSTAGTATVTVQYSTGVTVYDSTQSFTFTSASINVPSTALSTTSIQRAGVNVSSPASAPKAQGATNPALTMHTVVKDNNGAFIASGVSVEWTITGPAYFAGGNYKATATASGTTGVADSPVIWSTGAGGTATITTVIKYLGVSYSLSDKVINFIGDPAKIECTNSYYSIATDTYQPAGDPLVDADFEDDGAFECVVTDANGFALTDPNAVAFTATNVTPAAFWSLSGFDHYSTTWKAFEVGASCGSTTGKATANIKATVGTKSVTTADALSLTCANALTQADKGTISVDTSAGTTAQPGGQLALKVIVKDKNGLPAPDGTPVVGVTNGFGTVVRATTGRDVKGTVDGEANFIYLAPSTSGTAVVTFFGQGVTTPSNVSVTIGVGQAVSQPLAVSVKAGLPSQGGTYGSATPVVATGQYITWKGVGGAQLAGANIGILVAVKNADGSWGPFTRLTSRTADATGTVLFYWRSSTPTWVSVRFSVPTTPTEFLSVARQGRWR